MNIIYDPKPKFQSMEPTEKLLADQGYTFNEAGQSFNEAGVMFGGIYGPDGPKPKFDSIEDL
jgi:hypothetical protein